MKKILLFILIFITVFSSLPAVDMPSTNFIIYLNKKGTDELYFTETADADNSHVNEFMFPIISSNNDGSEPTELSASLYLHWIHQSEYSVKINLFFCGSETEDASTTEDGYMLSKTQDSQKSEVGLNYYVTFEGGTGSTETPEEITFTNSPQAGTTGEDGKIIISDLVSTMTAEQRTRTISLGKLGSTPTVVSPLKITMRIVAPYDEYTDTDGSLKYKQYWMEAQYYGYIKAEIQLL